MALVETEQCCPWSKLPYRSHAQASLIPANSREGTTGSHQPTQQEVKPPKSKMILKKMETSALVPSRVPGCFTVFLLSFLAFLGQGSSSDVCALSTTPAPAEPSTSLQERGTPSPKQTARFPCCAAPHPGTHNRTAAKHPPVPSSHCASPVCDAHQ